MLKVLIGLGLLLMLTGFGAAGWQYMQSMPAGPVVASDAAEQPKSGAAVQDWLTSRSGGLVPRAEVESYLVQDRFVPGRTVVVTQIAALADLLSVGEKLPEAPYLQVLADIRAPKVAAGACAALQEVLARDCAVHSARVVEGSVDRANGTAQFRIELAYTLKPVETELPALSERAFGIETIPLTFEARQEGAGTVADMIRASVTSATEACAAQKRTDGCRILRMDLDWKGDGAGSSQVQIGSLKRLPKGMYPAPPLG